MPRPYTDDVKRAVALLRGNAELVADAREGAEVGNTIAGAILTRPLGPIGSRQVAEAAVRAALKVLDKEGKTP
jgi:hypothetical protein